MTRAERRALFDSVLARATDGPGQLPAAVRRATADGTHLDDARLAALAEAIRSRALDVSREQVADARAAGYDEDQLFEFTVVTALGASRLRLRALQRALGRG